MSSEIRSRNYALDYPSMDEGYSSDEENVDPAVRVAEAIQSVRRDWDCPTIGYCAGLGGVVFAAIPPNGAFIPVGMAAGGLVGLAILKVRAHLGGNR